ncbi:hypothetical protein Vadar_001720 [Vaccinium darrowii]|uniref:Uncharacterized protein n=1 Tax=Vaccinium darrowii TaxID=229202 RepID=A0ACB7YJL2_9ERIC|nr:hypothetical protein Vadar_001720 [Vaccinium darrowii]
MMNGVGDAPLAPTPAVVQRSPWHSPVPYLFGGLAAMLGLIAFALLILACSYWKLSGHLSDDDDNNNNSSERDIELGRADTNEKTKLPPVFEEKILVIMAGQVNPTFLATPVSSRNSSFGSSVHSGGEKVDDVSDGCDPTEKRKQGSGDQVGLGNMESHEAEDQVL